MCSLQFLSAIMKRHYAEALKYCRLILQYEPHNATARGFYPLLLHKLGRNRRSDNSAQGATPPSAGEPHPHPQVSTSFSIAALSATFNVPIDFCSIQVHITLYTVAWWPPIIYENCEALVPEHNIFATSATFFL